MGTFGTGDVDFTPDGSRVYTLDSGSGVIAFSLAPKLAAPTICADPKNLIVAGPGSVGFFSVTAIGAPQNYQWRFNGATIAGATNGTLDLYNVQPSEFGNYSVVVSNAMNSVTSTVAYLDTRMVFTNQPASQVVAIGGTATLEGGVSNGLPAYTYQWQFNGTNLASAQVADAGGYTLIVTDSLGQAVTSPNSRF